MRIASIALAGLVLAALPSATRAANQLKMRTPADFGDVACMTTVQKGDVVHLAYSVFQDDTELTDDELPDSRGHQFFAFAQQRVDFQLPVWINRDDYDRADANGDVMQFRDADILTESTAWPAGTWVRITADDARVPITMAQAAMGVDWNTTDVAPGTWLVAGYTWEPEQNLWSFRMGAIRIVDPADPDAAGPSAFVDPDDAVLRVGEPYAVPGCIEAPPGSTITASWATLVGFAEPQWIAFVQDEPAQSGALMFDFTPPADAGDQVKLRVEITDPTGRRYVAYSPLPHKVLPGESDDDAGDDDGEGCRCRARERVAFPLFATLVLLGRRRASRARSRP